MTIANLDPKPWIIVGVDGQDYWSNEYGWTDCEADATRFTDTERARLRLPLDGKWEMVIANYDSDKED